MPYFNKNKRNCLKKRGQSGSGYFFDVNAEVIAGQPVVRGYNDWAPPLFVGELMDGRFENLQNTVSLPDGGSTPVYPVGPVGPQIPVSRIVGGKREKRSIKNKMSKKEKREILTRYIQSGGKLDLPDEIMEDAKKAGLLD
jgi:hypothetical protein